MSPEENPYNLINLNNQNNINSDNKTSMPYNLEAEQSLLGAILFDNTTLEKSMDLIRDYHLYDPLHQEIYQACLILFENNNLADPTTLKGYLKEKNIIFTRTITVKYKYKLNKYITIISNLKRIIKLCL